MREKESFMTISASLHKRKTLFLVILFIAFSAFTADILDLRDELRFLPCPYSFLDNSITTGITSHSTFETEPLLILFSAHQKSSFKISFLHLLPYGFRAPPSWS
jgi:hypothetical protein